jgi:hypothetical protein
MYEEDLKTILTPKPKKPKTCTFYCRGVQVKNKKFATDESKRLRFATIGKYIDALIEYRRTNGQEDTSEGDE